MNEGQNPIQTETNTPNPAPETPLVQEWTNPEQPTEKPKSKKRLYILIAIAAFLVVAAVVAYVLLSQKPAKQNTDTKTSDNSNIEKKKTTDTEEKETNKTEEKETSESNSTTTEPVETKYETVNFLYIGELQCVHYSDSDKWNHCDIPNEKIMNAKDDTRYSLVNTELDGLSDATSQQAIEQDGDTYTISIPSGYKTENGPYDDEPHTYTLSFDKPVDSYKILSFGQGMGDETVVFVTEAGDLYFIALKKIIAGDTTPKKYELASNIQTILQGQLCDFGCGVTHYAVSADGIMYEINEIRNL